MNITISTVLLNSFLSSIAILVTYHLFKPKYTLLKLGCDTIVLTLTLITARLFIPFEFPFTQTVSMTTVYPAVYDLLHTPLIYMWGFDFRLIHLILSVWVIGVIAGLIRLSYAYYTDIQTAKGIQWAWSLLPQSLNELRQRLNQYPEDREVIERQIQDLLTMQEASIQQQQVLESLLTEEEAKKLCIYCSGSISSPYVLGLRHPTIYMPSKIFSHTDLVFILSHEIAHVRNHDLLRKLALKLLCVVFWWNPITLLLKMRMEETFEIHSDICVTRAFPEPEREEKALEYLHCLLREIKNAKGAHGSVASGLAMSKGPNPAIVKRFQCILDYQEPNKIVRIAAIIISIALMIFSYTFVIEPVNIGTEKTEGLVTFKPYDSFIVEEQPAVYDIYNQGELLVTVDHLDETLSKLHKYDSLEEALENEKTQDYTQPVFYFYGRWGSDVS